LVVDDEQDILDLIRYQLEREGYQVVGCRDGRSALDLEGIALKRRVLGF
jgi:DNA-binding response OmpR family regulator